MSLKNNNLFNLKDKVAIVTGASKGIGLAISRGFAEFGAKVVISSRSQEALELAASDLQKEGLDVFAQACHVGDSNQRKVLVKKTIDEFGSIDILVNNAAINPIQDSIQNFSSELFDKMLNVNLKAAFDLSNLCFPYLKAKKEGSIINISSVEGLKPSLGLGIYSVTKASLNMLTQVQAKEWGIYGIRSNAICPGLIKTKFSSALWKNEQLMKHIKNQLPLGRAAEPIEISGLAVYLASSAGSYSTGGIYTVDGGHMTI
ncbi:MAG: short-chain dehydrogenase [Flavobacteriaceae bacterium]|nr:short-chain dehydrogenase [Flavobacteriaceae bacterium]|tara:strand:+ start:36149 stop:36925 length:777 start_codon:yes stop_codon:yes gene_type:complete